MKNKKGFTPLENLNHNHSNMNKPLISNAKGKIKNSRFLTGFTLIELLVVIAIIGLLASIVAVQVNKARAKGRTTQALATIKSIQVALEMYYDDWGKYPRPTEYGEGETWCDGAFDLGGVDDDADGDFFVDFLKQGGYLASSVKSPSGMSFVYAGEGASPCNCTSSPINYMLTVYGLPQSVTGVTDNDQCDDSTVWNTVDCGGEKGPNNYCFISK